MTVQDLESKLSHRPDSPLFARLASEYLAVNRIADAKQICFTGLKRFPQYPTAHLILARCLTAELDYSSALTALEQAQRFLPDGTVLLDFHKTLQTFITSPLPLEDNTIKQKIEYSSEVIEQNSQVSEYAFPLIQEEPKIGDTTVEKPAEEIPKENISPIGTVDEIPLEGIPINSTEETSQENTFTSDQFSEESNKIPVVPFQNSAQTEIMETSFETFGNGIQEDISRAPDQFQEPVNEVSKNLFQDAPPPAEIVQSEIPEESQNNISPVPQEPVLIDSQPSPPQEMNNVEYPNEVRIVSKTLAEIYASQGAYDEAIITYQLLKEYRPERTIECDTRIAELEILRQEKIKE